MYRRVCLAAAVAAILCVVAAPCFADVSLALDSAAGTAPALFSDGVVLQRDTNVPVWGTASPGENVSVTVAGQTKTVAAGGDGRWRVLLDPMTAGGPYEMTVSGNNTIKLEDVLVGDVWICAGQSNMVIRRPDQNELAPFPFIHTMGRGGNWKERPSAMAFVFGRDLQAELGVPIGLINRAAGGTSMRSWLPLSAENDPDPTVQAILATWDGWGDEYQHQVQPLAGFAIRGIVYWQGEQDLKLARQDPGNIDHFYHLLPALARAWRADWQIGQIPFVFVQLPTGGGLQQGQVVTPLPPSPPSPDIAMRMRQATFNGLSEPGTALMVSIDIPGSVHPRDHDLYGYRLATAALGTTYGESFAYSGPIYASMSIESGGHVRLKFKPNTADALQAVGGPLQGFSISADGQNFVWAQAEIQANEVVVWNDSIPSPSVVHYAWDKYPTWANLFNGAGLGTAPFSTTETPAP